MNVYVSFFTLLAVIYTIFVTRR